MNSVAETASTDVEFVGFTAPALFGHTGLKVGRSICPNLYPGSHICTLRDLEMLSDWSDFNAPSPVVIGHDQSDSDSGGPCNNFIAAESYDNGTIAIVAEANDNVIIRKISTEEPYAYSKWPISKSWLIENSISTGSTGDHDYPNSLYYYNPSSNPRFSICNTTVPAACCK